MLPSSISLLFRWSSGRWGPCSLTCGGEGVQHRNITCRHVTNSGQEEVAAERLCLFEEKPPQRRACRSPACPGRWRSGPWSKVKMSCAVLLSFYQTRKTATVRLSIGQSPRPYPILRAYKAVAANLFSTARPNCYTKPTDLSQNAYLLF